MYMFSCFHTSKSHTAAILFSAYVLISTYVCLSVHPNVVSVISQEYLVVQIYRSSVILKDEIIGFWRSKVKSSRSMLSHVFSILINAIYREWHGVCFMGFEYSLGLKDDIIQFQKDCNMYIHGAGCHSSTTSFTSIDLIHIIGFSNYFQWSIITLFSHTGRYWRPRTKGIYSTIFQLPRENIMYGPSTRLNTYYKIPNAVKSLKTLIKMLITAKISVWRDHCHIIHSQSKSCLICI